MSLTDSSTELCHGYMDQLRLPMLTIPSKQGVSIDLTSPLAELIRTEFGEDPTNFRQEVREFNQLRESAVRPSRDNNGTSAIRRYYAQLCLLPTRFAATRSNMQVTFIWSDAFTEKESANSILQSETTAILFNLGALHSRLGSDLPDELRSACTHFQCAAGAFYLLQSSLASHFTTANTQVDLSTEVIAFCKNLMLAQAQECMVEKSLLERKRPSLVSKVAWEVSSLYQKAIDLLDSQIGSQIAKKNKNWQKFLQTKFHIYQCVANYCQALSSEEESNYGQSIGYLQLAMDNILAASKVVKVLQPVVKNAVKYLTELVQAKSQSSVQTNQQVYHQLVPQYAELEELHGALLVKPIEFSTSDKSVLGGDIFCKLVPMSVLESNSMYSEEKANLLRSVCESIQDKDRELGEFLSRVNVDEVLNYKDNKIHIPSDVAIIRTEISNEEGRVEGMDALLQSVLQMSNQIHRKLDEISMYLTRDSPELANQILEFQNQADKIDEYLTQGDKSNQELHQVMKELKPKLAMLTTTDTNFTHCLPKIDLMAITFDETAENRLQMLMDKIQEMQTQRSTLEQQLRRDMELDDITSHLISSDTNRDKIFEDGMMKHKEAANVIRQNCQAQDNILKAMTETNASLAGLRKELLIVRSDRESVFKGLVEAWKRMGSTEDSLKDGMKFYQNLDKKTLKLFDTIKSVLPPPPIQQPISSSDKATIPPLDTYKPISPFMSTPDGTARPPVPSRRLKPANQTGDVKDDTEAVDDAELALLDWAATEQVNKQVNKQINNETIEPSADSFVRETKHEFSSLLLAQSNPAPKIDPILPSPPKPVTNQMKAPEPQLHIPQALNLATPVFDTSQLSQLIQSNQSETSRTICSLQSGLSGISQSVAELGLNMTAVINQSNQSNAAISSLNQVTTNQNTNIEQLSSHLQTTNQNTVYTSQLIKLVEANLLARIESIEKSSQEGVNRLNQLFDHVTQKQIDVFLKLEPLLDKINNNISASSQEVLSVATALSEVKEELRQIKNKQESILLLPNQSDLRVTKDPLNFQDRPKEDQSQVGQLWDLLEKKPEIVSHKPDTILTSDPTAFTPVKFRPSSAFQLSISQSDYSNTGVGTKLTNQISSLQPIENQSITSLDPLSTLPNITATSLSYSSMVPGLYSQQSVPHNITPAPVTQLLQPSLMPIQSIQSIPAVSHYPPQPNLHPHSNILTNQSNIQYPPQSIVQSNPQMVLQSAVQSNPQMPLQSAVQSNPQMPLQSAVQSNPQMPLQSAVQSNPQMPLQSAVQSNPQIPLQSAVQSNPQMPLQSAVQSNPQMPLQSAVQSNPQMPLQSAVQSNPPLNPQQHAYLQMLQKQLSSSSQSLTPDQLIVIQKQLLLLSQTHQ